MLSYGLNVQLDEVTLPIPIEDMLTLPIPIKGARNEIGLTLILAELSQSIVWK